MCGYCKVFCGTRLCIKGITSVGGGGHSVGLLTAHWSRGFFSCLLLCLLLLYLLLLLLLDNMSTTLGSPHITTSTSMTSSSISRRNREGHRCGGIRDNHVLLLAHGQLIVRIIGLYCCATAALHWLCLWIDDYIGHWRSCCLIIRVVIGSVCSSVCVSWLALVPSTSSSSITSSIGIISSVSISTTTSSSSTASIIARSITITSTLEGIGSFLFWRLLADIFPLGFQRGAPRILPPFLDYPLYLLLVALQLFHQRFQVFVSIGRTALLVLVRYLHILSPQSFST
mmetsp:Transcript_25714/g.38463  ORF Transcript_25714/g.38463 Transcript_25714/m.38463 type:complete len:284 (-) Transcript_25714:111-962(-)